MSRLVTASRVLWDLGLDTNVNARTTLNDYAKEDIKQQSLVAQLFGDGHHSKLTKDGIEQLKLFTKVASRNDIDTVASNFVTQFRQLKRPFTQHYNAAAIVRILQTIHAAALIFNAYLSKPILPDTTPKFNQVGRVVVCVLLNHLVELLSDERLLQTGSVINITQHINNTINGVLDYGQDYWQKGCAEYQAYSSALLLVISTLIYKSLSFEMTGHLPNSIHGSSSGNNNGNNNNNNKQPHGAFSFKLLKRLLLLVDEYSQIDFEDASAQTLLEQSLYFATSRTFLSYKQGRDIIITLLTSDLILAKHIHNTIKSYLYQCKLPSFIHTRCYGRNDDRIPTLTEQVLTLEKSKQDFEIQTYGHLYFDALVKLLKARHHDVIEHGKKQEQKQKKGSSSTKKKTTKKQATTKKKRHVSSDDDDENDSDIDSDDDDSDNDDDDDYDNVISVVGQENDELLTFLRDHCIKKYFEASLYAKDPELCTKLQLMLYHGFIPGLNDNQSISQLKKDLITELFSSTLLHASTVLNNHIRFNAIKMLNVVFPMRIIDSTAAEIAAAVGINDSKTKKQNITTLIQTKQAKKQFEFFEKQIDIFIKLLYDECIEIRLLTLKVLGNVMSGPTNWSTFNVLPQKRDKILNTIFTALTRDQTALEIRIQALLFVQRILTSVTTSSAAAVVGISPDGNNNNTNTAGAGGNNAILTILKFFLLLEPCLFDQQEAVVILYLDIIQQIMTDTEQNQILLQFAQQQQRQQQARRNNNMSSSTSSITTTTTNELDNIMGFSFLPPDKLIVALATTKSPAVATRLTSLLATSFLPTDHNIKATRRIECFLKLLRFCPKAAVSLAQEVYVTPLVHSLTSPNGIDDRIDIGTGLSTTTLLNNLILFIAPLLSVITLNAKYLSFMQLLSLPEYFIKHDIKQFVPNYNIITPNDSLKQIMLNNKNNNNDDEDNNNHIGIVNNDKKNKNKKEDKKKLNKKKAKKMLDTDEEEEQSDNDDEDQQQQQVKKELDADGLIELDNPEGNDDDNEEEEQDDDDHEHYYLQTPPQIQIDPTTGERIILDGVLEQTYIELLLAQQNQSTFIEIPKKERSLSIKDLSWAMLVLSTLFETFNKLEMKSTYLKPIEKYFQQIDFVSICIVNLEKYNGCFRTVELINNNDTTLNDNDDNGNAGSGQSAESLMSIDLSTNIKQQQQHKKKKNNSSSNNIINLQTVQVNCYTSYFSPLLNYTLPQHYVSKDYYQKYQLIYENKRLEQFLGKVNNSIKQEQSKKNNNNITKDQLKLYKEVNKHVDISLDSNGMPISATEINMTDDDNNNINDKDIIDPNWLQIIKDENDYTINNVMTCILNICVHIPSTCYPYLRSRYLDMLSTVHAQMILTLVFTQHQKAEQQQGVDLLDVLQQSLSIQQTVDYIENSLVELQQIAEDDDSDNEEDTLKMDDYYNNIQPIIQHFNERIEQQQQEQENTTTPTSKIIMVSTIKYSNFTNKEKKLYLNNISQEIIQIASDIYTELHHKGLALLQMKTELHTYIQIALYALHMLLKRLYIKSPFDNNEENDDEQDNTSNSSFFQTYTDEIKYYGSIIPTKTLHNIINYLLLNKTLADKTIQYTYGNYISIGDWLTTTQYNTVIIGSNMKRGLDYTPNLDNQSPYPIQVEYDENGNQIQQQSQSHDIKPIQTYLSYEPYVDATIKQQKQENGEDVNDNDDNNTPIIQKTKYDIFIQTLGGVVLTTELSDTIINNYHTGLFNSIGKDMMYINVGITRLLHGMSDLMLLNCQMLNKKINLTNYNNNATSMKKILMIQQINNNTNEQHEDEHDQQQQQQKGEVIKANNYLNTLPYKQTGYGVLDYTTAQKAYNKMIKQTKKDIQSNNNIIQDKDIILLNLINFDTYDFAFTILSNYMTTSLLLISRIIQRLWTCRDSYELDILPRWKKEQQQQQQQQLNQEKSNKNKKQQQHQPITTTILSNPLDDEELSNVVQSYNIYLNVLKGSLYTFDCYTNIVTMCTTYFMFYLNSLIHSNVGITTPTQYGITLENDMDDNDNNYSLTTTTTTTSKKGGNNNKRIKTQQDLINDNDDDQNQLNNDIIYLNVNFEHDFSSLTTAIIQKYIDLCTDALMTQILIPHHIIQPLTSLTTSITYNMLTLTTLQTELNCQYNQQNKDKNIIMNYSNYFTTYITLQINNILPSTLRATHFLQEYIYNARLIDIDLYAYNDNNKDNNNNNNNINSIKDYHVLKFLHSTNDIIGHFSTWSTLEDYTLSAQPPIADLVNTAIQKNNQTKFKQPCTSLIWLGYQPLISLSTQQLQPQHIQQQMKLITPQSIVSCIDNNNDNQTVDNIMQYFQPTYAHGPQHATFLFNSFLTMLYNIIILSTTNTLINISPTNVISIFQQQQNNNNIVNNNNGAILPSLLLQPKQRNAFSTILKNLFLKEQNTTIQFIMYRITSLLFSMSTIQHIVQYNNLVLYQNYQTKKYLNNDQNCFKSYIKLTNYFIIKNIELSTINNNNIICQALMLIKCPSPQHLKYQVQRVVPKSLQQQQIKQENGNQLQKDYNIIHYTYSFFDINSNKTATIQLAAYIFFQAFVLLLERGQKTLSVQNALKLMNGEQQQPINVHGNDPIFASQLSTSANPQLQPAMLQLIAQHQQIPSGHTLCYALEALICSDVATDMLPKPNDDNSKNKNQRIKKELTDTDDEDTDDNNNNNKLVNDIDLSINWAIEQQTIKINYATMCQSSMESIVLSLPLISFSPSTTTTTTTSANTGNHSNNTSHKYKTSQNSTNSQNNSSKRKRNDNSTENDDDVDYDNCQNTRLYNMYYFKQHLTLFFVLLYSKFKISFINGVKSGVYNKKTIVQIMLNKYIHKHLQLFSVYAKNFMGITQDLIPLLKQNVKQEGSSQQQQQQQQQDEQLTTSLEQQQYTMKFLQSVDELFNGLEF